MLKDDRNFEPGKAYRLRDHFNGQVNVTPEDILRNIRANIRRPLMQVSAYRPQPKTKVMMLCGGPSMADHVAQIKRLRKRGWKIAALNGAHNWCLEHDLQPSVHIMLDARPWNVRFVDSPVKKCRYLISSQCDPSVFDALEGYETLIWHAVSKDEAKILKRYYNGRFCNVKGGTTVGTRAINLLYLLGFRNIAIYGMDSCIQKGKHHAYLQPENDQEIVHKIRVGRRTFYAHPWMSVQADELMQTLPLMPHDINLDFRGDNMISYLINYVAEHKRVPKTTIIDETRTS